MMERDINISDLTRDIVQAETQCQIYMAEISRLSKIVNAITADMKLVAETLEKLRPILTEDDQR